MVKFLNSGLRQAYNNVLVAGDLTLGSTNILATLDSKAPIDNPSFTGEVVGVTKSTVGLRCVDNTSDLNSPISTAVQSALALKYHAFSLDSNELQWDIFPLETPSRKVKTNILESRKVTRDDSLLIHEFHTFRFYYARVEFNSEFRCQYTFEM